jgi:hypothetical protein
MSSGKECKKWCWNEGKSIKRPVICPVAHSAVLITWEQEEKKLDATYMGINLITFFTAEIRNVDNFYYCKFHKQIYCTIKCRNFSSINVNF